MRNFLFVFLLTACCIKAAGQVDTTEQIVPRRRNSPEQQKKPYLVIISSDGFRYDYAEKHNAVSLQKFGREGIRAASLIPSFPTLTFPNHYTIATGLYPSHHGLVNNYFYSTQRKQDYAMSRYDDVIDGSWYGGTPLWVLAEQQQMLTASFYWVAADAPIKGILPTYYFHYNTKISIDKRIQIVLDWLNLPPERRPHIIFFYFPQTDHEGHLYGPDAPETGQAVRLVDSAIHKLTDGIKATGLPVNFIFTADHGMTAIDTAHSIPQPASLDSSLFIIPRGIEFVALYAKNKKDILPVYKKLKKEEKNFAVYLKSNMPAHLHYGIKDDRMNRIGDILLMPQRPYVFRFDNAATHPGAHGFDPLIVKDMQAAFYAWGPGFKEHITVPSFENVNIYPIVTKLLGLRYTEKIDGTAAIADQVLK